MSGPAVDPIEFGCGDCMALPHEPCTIASGFHDARHRASDGDAWADDWTAGALDLDGDGRPGALDHDDPSNWV